MQVEATRRGKIECGKKAEERQAGSQTSQVERTNENARTGACFSRFQSRRGLVGLAKVPSSSVRLAVS